MSKGTKNQFYRYSMRSVMGRNMSLCQDIFMFEVIPPDNALTIENLFTRIRMTFDSPVPVAQRKIERIGIVNDFRPQNSTFDVAWNRYIDINKEADANRVIDFYMDLSSLLNHSNAGINDSYDGSDDDATLIYIKLPGSLRNYVSGMSSVYGSIDVWKADAIYTTTEIR